MPDHDHPAEPQKTPPDTPLHEQIAERLDRALMAELRRRGWRRRRARTTVFRPVRRAGVRW